MFKQTSKPLASIVLCLAMVIATSCVNTQNEPYTLEKTANYSTLLDEKIKYYKSLYPEIVFLILKGDDEVSAEMLTLDHTLGYQPKSMDYEHPAELRETLMFVSKGRIRLMLQSNTPSASLYETGTAPDQREHVCVLTINPHEVAADSISATQYLLDLPREFIQKIPKEMQLSPRDFFAFIIDHEVYHCLRAMYVGPQLMSYKEFWGGYNIFHNELGADAYALVMHIKTKGNVSLFAKNLHRLRDMALYNADPDHLTCKSLDEVLKTPLKDIVEMSTHEIFDMANRIKNRLTVSYGEYVQHLASKVQAMKELGVGKHISGEFVNKIENYQADPAQVKALVTNSRRCYAELSGNELSAYQN